MCEMYSEAYNKWIEIFNDDLLEIWQKERKELQKASMLLSALQNELKNVQTNVEVEIINIRQQLKLKDVLLERRNSLSPQNKTKRKSPNTMNKENEYDSKLIVATEILEDKSRFTETESPDLFKNIISQCSPAEASIIDLSISDEDARNDNGSPTIKRRRKRYIKNKSSSSAFGCNIMNESKQTVNTPTNSICNKDLIKANLFKTSLVKSDNELSVIENTPEVIPKKLKTNSKIGRKTSKKNSKRAKLANITLTQMIGGPKRRLELTTSKKAVEDADSDETYFEDTKERSKMGITDLLGLINKDETTRFEEESQSADKVNDDQTTYYELNLDSTEEVDEFSKGAIFNETDLATSSEKPKVLTPEPEPVVRGKARKQLQGWACEKCKNFYGKMKLSREELKKKMDECSRHRYKFRPPEDTLPGYWDLSIPPENPG